MNREENIKILNNIKTFFEHGKYRMSGEALKIQESYIMVLDETIKDVQSWDEIEKSGMPTLVIEDCAYILDKGCMDALIKYSEEQNKKELEEFGDFLKEVIKNEL